MAGVSGKCQLKLDWSTIEGHCLEMFGSLRIPEHRTNPKGLSKIKKELTFSEDGLSASHREVK